MGREVHGYVGGDLHAPMVEAASQLLKSAEQFLKYTAHFFRYAAQFLNISVLFVVFVKLQQILVTNAVRFLEIALQLCCFTRRKLVHGAEFAAQFLKTAAQFSMLQRIF